MAQGYVSIPHVEEPISLHSSLKEEKRTFLTRRNMIYITPANYSVIAERSQDIHHGMDFWIHILTAVMMMIRLFIFFRLFQRI
jgi:hypothetical protein